MADKQITRRLHIYVNGQEVQRTITNINKSLSEFRSKANRATEGTDEWEKYNAEVAKLEVELGNARAAQKEFRDESKKTLKDIDDNGKGLVDFTGNLNKMWQGYRTGDLISVREGFHGVKTGIQGATKSAIAFIATPIGAAIAVLAGIGVAAKAWLNYNSQVVEAIRTTTAITGLTNNAADQARINAETLQEVYGADFETTLTTAKKLVAQFGVSYDEAFATIEDGLARGQGKNKEYFDSLGEYGTFFESAGYSAQQFKDIISTGYDLSIYSDKLPDALKEADLSLKEQSTATKDALVNAFGASFSNDLLKKIRTGEMSTKDALTAISQESEKANLNQQQLGQLTADVFKGAGEDVGGAAKIFEALSIAIEGTKKPLTESQQLLVDQAEATRQLKEVSSSLFATGDKGFGLLVDKAKLFGTKVLVDILTTGVDVINWFIDLNNRSGAFAALLSGIGKAATGGFEVLGILLSNAWESVKGLGNLIEGVFTFNPDKIKQGLSQGVGAITGVISDLKNKAVTDINDIYNAFNGEAKIDKITINKTEDDTGLTPDQIAKIAAEKKSQEEKLKLVKKTEDEITEILKKARTKREIDAKLGLEKTYAEIDEKYRVSLEKAKNNAELTKQLEEQIALEKADAKAKHLLDLNAREQEIKNQIELENAATEEEKEILKAEQDAEKEAAKLEQLKLTKEEETRLLALLEESEQSIIAGIKKKYANKNLKEQKKNYEKELKYKKKLNNDIIDGAIGLADSQSRIGQGLLAIKGILAAKESLISLGLLKTKVAVNAAEASSDVAKGGAKAASALPFPANIPLILGFAAQAVGIISAVRNATSKANSIKPASFHTGGFTDGLGTGYIDETGEEVANAKLHVDEYVVPRFVRKMPEVPAVIQWLENKRKNKTQSFASGGSVSNTDTIADAPVETLLGENSNHQYLTESIDRLNNLLENGLYINYTIEDEVERQKIQKLLETTINNSKK